MEALCWQCGLASLTAIVQDAVALGEMHCKRRIEGLARVARLRTDRRDRARPKSAVWQPRYEPSQPETQHLRFITALVNAGLCPALMIPPIGTFPPNGSGFCRPTGLRGPRSAPPSSRQWKVGNDDILFRLEENVTLSEIHKLSVGFEHSAINFRDRREKTISRPMAPNILVNHPSPPE